MEVQTFECSEVAAEPIEATEEAIGLMESLGLESQLSLVRPKDDGPAARCPYREMTRDEFFVYQILCPTRFTVKNYSASPIPLRVLQILAHAQSLNRFERFEIWDRDQIAVTDPVLVAHTGSQWSSQSKCFILARWGSELETFAVLLKRAIEAKKDQLMQGILAVKSRIDSEVHRVSSMTSAQIVAVGPAAEVTLTVPGA